MSQSRRLGDRRGCRGLGSCCIGLRPRPFIPSRRPDVLRESLTVLAALLVLLLTAALVGPYFIDWTQASVR